jgi:tRNA (uracil-5-)-methyltransferase
MCFCCCFSVTSIICILVSKIYFSALEKEKSRTEKLSLYPWLLQQRCIDIKSIVSAPTPLRNKCELTFGYQYMFPSESTTESRIELQPNVIDATTDVEITPVSEIAAVEIEPIKIPAVGFMVTGWAGGVSFSNTLPNIPNEVGTIVEIINAFLTTSPLVPYDSTTHDGFWRILTIRTSRRTKECMIIVQHNLPEKQQLLSSETMDWNAIFATEKDRLISLLIDTELPTAHDQPAIKVTSVFFQEFSGLSNPTPEHPIQVR